MTASQLMAVATLLHVLAEAERARLEGDTDAVDRLLEAVDPIDADLLSAAAGLEAVFVGPGHVRVTERVYVRTPW